MSIKNIIILRKLYIIKKLSLDIKISRLVENIRAGEQPIQNSITSE